VLKKRRKFKKQVHLSFIYWYIAVLVRLTNSGH
jgi:hypothetical protein